MTSTEKKLKVLLIHDIQNILKALGEKPLDDDYVNNLSYEEILAKRNALTDYIEGYLNRKSIDK